MGTMLLRFQTAGGPKWGVRDGSSVREFIGDGLAQVLASRTWERPTGATHSLESLDLLAPVTAPCQIVCQGKNYLNHLIETGAKAEDKDYNILFTKADSSLKGPGGFVERPAGVRLLDYEVELGLVMGREITAGVKVTEENLSDYVAGFVLANDVSARDVQVPQKQWLKGKSYRGFCPVGPWIFVPTRSEFALWRDLQLLLTVNGEKRQAASVKQLLFGPVETLNEIAGIFDLRPGDLLLTGTPGGVAMRMPPPSRWELLRDALKGEKQKSRDFVAAQALSPRYLKDGDRVEALIRTPGGEIDLGVQSWTVKG